MALQYRYADKAMMSWIYRETAYDTVMTGYSTTEYTQLRNFTLAIGYDDTRVPALLGDGTEFGLESYVSRHDVRMTLTLNMATFTDIAALSAYALGITGESETSGDFLHDHTLASDSQLPSFTVVASEGGQQYAYSGCVIDTLTVSTDNAGYIQVVAEIIGSGRRTSNAESFITALSDPPMVSNDTSIFTEIGGTTAIQALSENGETSLVATTVTSGYDLTSRVLGGWTVVISNNLRAEQGYQKPNSTDHFARGECLRGARREMTATLSGVTFEDVVHMTNFLGAATTAIQPHLSLEISNYNENYGVIANALYYTMSIIFPRMTLDPHGASGDDDGIITRDLKLTALTPVVGTDGTADPIQFYVRDEIPEYAGAAG